MELKGDEDQVGFGWGKGHQTTRSLMGRGRRRVFSTLGCGACGLLCEAAAQTRGNPQQTSMLMCLMATGLIELITLNF
jgi:hypothetical protein